MKQVWKWLLTRSVLGTLGVLALSALVWWIGPLVAIGAARPLDGTMSRVVALLVLWSAWLGWLAWGAWRRRRAGAALLHGVATASAADRESRVLEERFRDAVAKLSRSRGGRSWFGSGDALYELPWYVFVGAPGSGKTTALLNAGLDFVLAEQGAAIRGVGGTRNCDWWFTERAVLVDTAGRYAMQDSDRAADAAAWDTFLALLRRTRPRRPINGVLLTVSVQDLLQQGGAERKEHAQKLQARLHELQAKLGVRAPVYVLVTKTDLVAGFMETFDRFGKEQRDQVWGFTFDAASSEQPLRDFDARYDELVDRCAGGLTERLQGERDAGRRAAMFGFVQEFASLKPLLGEFLAQVFAAGASPTALRGVYFTSGTQEGTPIDRVMGQLARSFGIERSAATAAGRQGKSFFLHRLLADLVFNEAHLVSFNARAERRRVALRAAGFAAVAVAGVAVLVGWAVSYARNKAYDAEVAARVPALKQLVDALPPPADGNVAALLPALDAARDVARSEQFDVGAPPLLNTLGLYLGDKLAAGAELGHAKLLEQALLPRVTRRVEERLRAANKEQLEQAYEALKGYLMLYTPEHFEAADLKAWIAVDWDAQYGGLAADKRASLDRHLDTMLALGAPRPAAPMDKALVGAVRDMLASFPLEFRVYSRLRRQFRSDLPEFTVAGAAGPEAPKVFERASGEPLSRGVAGFYTREGYQKAFQGTLKPAIARLAAEDEWVLGRRTNAAQAALGSDVEDRVRRLYLQDYVKAWDGFIADVRLVNVGDLARSLDVARILGGVDSPLAAYLRAVARETTLVAAPRTDAISQAAKQAKDKMAKLVDAAPVTGGGPIERIVDDHFAPLHRMVSGQPAPVDEMAATFRQTAALLQEIKTARDTKSAPPPAAAGAALKAAAGQQPEPVRSMLESLVDAGAKQGRATEQQSLTMELKPIFDLCTRAVANRYPFAPASRADVLPEDFGQLFGVGGLLDDFYQRRLAASVDTSGATWTYKPLPDGTRPPGAAAIAEFQRAARIKDVFFRAGGRVPAFRFDLRPLEFGDGLKEVVLEIDGQAHKFTPADSAPFTVSGPAARADSQIRLSAQPGGTPQVFEGPWALFRMFDRFEVQPGAQPERFTVVLNLDGRRAKFAVTANSVYNPYRMREMQQFRCPGAL